MAEKRVLSLVIDLKDKASAGVKAAFGGIQSAVQATTRVMVQAVAAVAGYALATAKLTERGGDVLNVQRAFGRVAGDVDGALLRLRDSTEGLISNYDLMLGMNRAVTLGAAENVEDFATMSNAAIALGRSLGVDAASALESITLGIGRMSKPILDNLGLLVSVEEANQAYADSLRINVNQLTDAQQREAFRTAALKAAEEAVTTLGGVTLTAADQLGRMKTSFANLRDELGKFLAESPTLRTFFSEMANIGETVVLAIETRDMEVIGQAFGHLGRFAGLTFLGAMRDAIAGGLEWMLSAFVGISMIPGLDWVDDVAMSTAQFLRSGADAARETADAEIEALGALRRQLELKREAEGRSNPANIPTLDPIVGRVPAVLREIVIGEQERLELLLEGHRLGTLTLEEQGELVAASGRLNEILAEGNLSLEERVALIERAGEAMLAAQDIQALEVTRVPSQFRFGPPDLRQVTPESINTDFQFGDPFVEWRKGIEKTLSDQDRLRAGVSDFGQAVGSSFGAAIMASEDLGAAMRTSILSALADAAAAKGAFYLGESLAAFGQGLLFGSPGAFAAAGKYAAASSIMFGIGAGAARAAGGGGGGGGGGAYGGSGSRLDGAARGDATIVLKGGPLFDMSNPDVEESFRRALEDLSGRRVIVVKG